MKNQKIIVFTNTYPYSAVAESFLHLEILYLSKTFRDIVIVPQRKPSTIENIKRKLPDNVFVEDGLLLKKIGKKSNYFKIIILSVFSKYLYKELLSHPSQIFNLTKLKKAVGHLGIAIQYRNWLVTYIKKNNINLSNTIFYTYWLSPMSLGVGMCKYNHSNLKFVSRAHGSDLYFERHKTNYIPYREVSLYSLDKLFLISDSGKKYIKDQFPKFESKYEISKLGVSNPYIDSISSKDGIFRIVSCSYLVPVKRISLLIEGLKELGHLKPHQIFEWYHIGYGPLHSKMEKVSKELLPINVKYNFLGFLKNEDVLSYYKNNSVDVFINVSSSEGIPVSIMEAQSFGIPVIATDVGGVSEIVSNSVGVLLPSNPTPTDIAQSICKFLDDPTFANKTRMSSKNNWSRNYDAEKNHMEFGRRLANL
jgi:glycosyltransferase involved in cell wall biosynthesis